MIFGTSISENLGRKLGLFVRNSFQNFFKIILNISFSEKINRKNIVIFLIFVVMFFVAGIIYNMHKNSKIQDQIVKYYYIQNEITDSKAMSLQDIKSNFLTNFDSILRVNNGFKVVNELYLSETRYKDAIDILKFIQNRSNLKHINQIIDIDILTIELLHKVENPKIEKVKKIANSQSFLSPIAKELIAEIELGRKNYEEYYKMMRNMYEYANIESRYMKDRVEEATYIGSYY
ncbi:hypothetical protein [Candidatus Deianiraea vastatrix]|uniref:Uncharacterized protein n=1 Tax=Candidatus Deianiraea vastatrix TaxID=2163644 RepID=A0A5B8XE64_9RICK|nr:hypothetical protein [Candidatus Deianiraea vastatrix]QED23266.1 hypothetical protein Deia_00466 [Candidatus Deianiraea vastatrix]